MKYTRNAIYTYIRSKVLTEYPNANVTGRFEYAPAVFPTVYVIESDRYSSDRNTTFEYDDEQYTSTFEVRVVSNKTDSAIAECESITEIVRKSFKDLFFNQISQATIDSGTQLEFVSRYSGTHGIDDVMPIEETTT